MDSAEAERESKMVPSLPFRSIDNGDGKKASPPMRMNESKFFIFQGQVDKQSERG